MKDAGHISICRLTVTNPDTGAMPVEGLEEVTAADFEERTFGMNRQYLAKGVDEQIDLLVRIWRDGAVRIGMFAVVTESEYDGQYRITDVRHQLDDDNLKVTDITLMRLNQNYEIVSNGT